MYVKLTQRFIILVLVLNLRLWVKDDCVYLGTVGQIIN